MLGSIRPIEKIAVNNPPIFIPPEIILCSFTYIPENSSVIPAKAKILAIKPVT